MTDSPVTPDTQTAGALTPGTTFAGKFEILELLGEGGMSSVYKARHINMDRVVALKVLHPWVLGEGKAAQRFLREARAVSGLNHPNIVKIITFDIEAETPYMAMELLQGGSLAEYIKKKGRISADEATEIALQAAQALAHAHAAGIIHRDIKPGNIMLLPPATESQTAPRVQLVDFGVAKLLDAASIDQQKLTQTNSVIGTPFYMSPEQCQKAPLDARSDMYALGCVLYEMLSGEPPFQGDSPLAVMFNHIHDEPPALPKSVPQWLNALTMRMMAKNPDDRLASMDEVAAVLKQSSAPLTIPKRKSHFRPTLKINKLFALVAIIGLMWGCTKFLQNELEKEKEAKVRKEKAAEFHRTYEDEKLNGDPSFARQADLLWNEAEVWGYPEGSMTAKDAMDKMSIEFFVKGSHTDLAYCQKVVARTEAYMTTFRDKDIRWRGMLLSAARNTYTLPHDMLKKCKENEKEFWTNETRKGARLWMEKATQWKDKSAYVQALAARIDCGDLQGAEMKKALLDSIPQLTKVRAHGQSAQNDLSGALDLCAEEVRKIDPNKALAIHENAIAGFASQYGADAPATLIETYNHDRFLVDAGKEQEGTQLL